jgi:hypothetical protein
MTTSSSPSDLYWLTEHVGIPHRLLDALNSNSLVIFAGAGVSISSPSNLPSFEDLAQKLASQSGNEYKKDSDIAQFLGRISDSFDVHKQTHQLIANQVSHPNDLHRVILELASSRGEVRVVTTNFDNHFIDAAQQCSIVLPKIWTAPALPIGSRFAGLVHIHGSIADGHEQLILTDQDLGKAYLLDAWATRFLIQMFESFTVLFVGYSHKDPMMRYLGLALSSSTPRYALVEDIELDNDSWNRLNIVPIQYPCADNDHSALLDALASWHSLTRMRVTDHRNRMKELVQSEQPLRPADSSYLEHRFTSDDGLEDFVVATSNLDPPLRENWLTWAEGQKRFQSLFNSLDLNQASWRLAGWFGDCFLAEPLLSDRAFETVLRLGTSFSEPLFRACVIAAWRLAEKDKASARRWLAFLDSSITGKTLPRSSLALTNYLVPFSNYEATSVLRCLTPYLQLGYGMVTRDASRPLPSAELHLPVPEETLSPLINSLVLDGKSKLTEVLCALENALLLAYSLNNAWYGDPQFDSISFRRSAIEEHEQDQFRSSLSPIIDGLRDLGRILLSRDIGIVERWWGYEYPLFRRLTIFLVSQDAARSSNSKIRWILERNLLFDYEAKHEVFQLLREALKDASIGTRTDLLERALVGPIGNDLSRETDDVRNYEIVNLLHWITEVDPTWSDALNALEAILKRNPSFGRRDQPNFNHWIGPFTAAEFPWVSLEEMIQRLEESPRATLEWISELDDDPFPFSNRSRSSALAVLSQAIASLPHLGQDCLQILDSVGISESDVLKFASAVLDGWAEAQSLEPIGGYLPSITRLAKYQTLNLSLSKLLLTLVEGNRRSIDLVVVRALQTIALDIYLRSRDSFVIHNHDDSTSVAPLFLNSWPGHLANFWIHSISVRWSIEKDSWTGLNDQELTGLLLFLDDSYDTFEAAMPALAIQLLFLFSADSNFATNEVLPLFSRDSSLLLAWTSFLRSPRVNFELLHEGFLESIFEFFGSLTHLGDDELRRSFFLMIFDICSAIPITSDVRQKLLTATVVSEGGMYATEFAELVVFRLHHTSLDTTEIWDQWLESHVRERLEGRPRIASGEELEIWADIVPFMRTRSAQAIRLLSMRSIGISRRSSVYLADKVNSADPEELISYYTQRIRNSNVSSEQVKREVQALVRWFSNEFGEQAAQPMIQTARNLGFFV